MGELKSKWYKPLIFFELYLTISVILFFYGPWPWNPENKFQLIIFLFLSQLSILIGYKLSWNKIKKLEKPFLNKKNIIIDIESGKKFFKLSIILAILMIIPTSLSRTGTFIPNILGGVTDAGLAYNENNYRLSEGNIYVMVEYIRIIFSYFLVAVIPLGILYWKIINFKYKVLFIIVVISTLSIYAATGTNKGIADIIITIPWLYYMSRNSVEDKRRYFNVKYIIFSLLILLSFILFLEFFGSGQSNREGGVVEFGFFNAGGDLFAVNKNHFLSYFLSENYFSIFESLTRYLTQGYYALALSFGLDTPSTLGFGNSFFMARNMNSLFNTNYFSYYSIPGQLEVIHGWSMFGLWHSIYPWLASDFGYLGTILIMGYFGYLLGLTYGLSLITKSHYSYILFYMLIILFYYIPANNQLLQSGESLTAFFIAVYLFYRNSKKYNI